VLAPLAALHIFAGMVAITSPPPAQLDGSHPHRGRSALAVALLALAVAEPAAAVVSLTDGNSVVEVSPDSPAGIDSWRVDGVEQLGRSWFYYRITSASNPGLDTGRELSIDSIGPPTVSQGGPGSASIEYGNGTFAVELNLNLQGGVSGSGFSDLAQQLVITNLSGHDITFSLFQYANFNLAGDAAGDNVAMFAGGQVIQQSEGPVTLTELFDAVGDSVLVPRPNFIEAAFAPDIVTRLDDGDVDDLAVPVLSFATSDSEGEGDVSWGVQWDFELSASGFGQSVGVSKDLRLLTVPEPSLGLLFVAGCGALLGIRRRVA